MQFNLSTREITLKIVYYGPPLSGKTTNLQAIHQYLRPGLCGHLTTLDTAEDRTLFFDMLPVVMRAGTGFTFKLKLLTVPGQVVHAATRRLVLKGADGVVFVADSQLSESHINSEYWHGMRHYLSESGIDPTTIPTVIQFNKRDLPDIRSDAELDVLALQSREPLFRAVAVRGVGVLATLKGVTTLMFADLNRRYEFATKFSITADDFIREILGNNRAGEVVP